MAAITAAAVADGGAKIDEAVHAAFDVLRKRVTARNGGSFVGSVSLSGSRSAGVDAVSNLANVSSKNAASYTMASSVRR